MEKLDHEDDSTATWLGSADTLEWLTEEYPELMGPIVYLFIFYELIDAYQNQSMAHVEHTKLVF